jgi:hypothetical protein
MKFWENLVENVTDLAHMRSMIVLILVISGMILFMVNVYEFVVEREELMELHEVELERGGK